VLILRKEVVKRRLTFPADLTSSSALPDKTRKHKNTFFTPALPYSQRAEAAAATLRSRRRRNSADDVVVVVGEQIFDVVERRERHARRPVRLSARLREPHRTQRRRSYQQVVAGTRHVDRRTAVLQRLGVLQETVRHRQKPDTHRRSVKSQIPLR